MRNAAIEWAVDALIENGYALRSHVPDVVQDTPWSEVTRFQTNQGSIFLKVTPPALALEAYIINFLHDEFQAHVPTVIAINHDLKCFLMKDAGIRLFDYMTNAFQSDILVRAVQQYANLQILSLNKIEELIALGLPDWRLEKLPVLYLDLLAQEELLLQDGLSRDDLSRLRQLHGSFTKLCERLSEFAIHDTFGHADFHDKNILINPEDQQITMIDLGEVVVTYPFFSFLNCLHRAKENFALTEAQYQASQQRCFAPWLEIESEKNLLEIMSIMRQCWSIHSALGEYRLISSVDGELNRQGRLARNLRVWMQGVH